MTRRWRRRLIPVVPKRCRGRQKNMVSLIELIPLLFVRKPVMKLIFLKVFRRVANVISVRVRLIFILPFCFKITRQKWRKSFRGAGPFQRSTVTKLLKMTRDLSGYSSRVTRVTVITFRPRRMTVLTRFQWQRLMGRIRVKLIRLLLPFAVRRGYSAPPVGSLLTLTKRFAFLLKELIIPGPVWLTVFLLSLEKLLSVQIMRVTWLFTFWRFGP